MKTLVSVIALMLVAPAAQAQTPADPAPGAKLDKNDPNAIRCRRLEKTGSLVRKDRICKTNAEWAKSRDQQQRDAGEFIERSRAGMNPNG